MRRRRERRDGDDADYRTDKRHSIVIEKRRVTAADTLAQGLAQVQEARRLLASAVTRARGPKRQASRWAMLRWAWPAP